MEFVVASNSTQLLPREIFWRDHYDWLKKEGYMLRPRYHPNWTPSWKDKPNASADDYEDSREIRRAHILDATRISDGRVVTLKRISTRDHPFEVEITKFFSTEPIASHPRNHCVRLLGVLSVPDDKDAVILVLPLLRKYNNPRFKSVGEAVEFFQQIFEGLQFIHQCHVAHRDCMNLNIMMDPTPMFPDLYHPIANRRKRDFSGRAKYYTRTARPVKYYFIDFGISRKYSPDDPHPLEHPIIGGDKTVPEFQYSIEPCDPFATDIYYLGNLIREDFLQKTKSVEFMAPLVADMVQDDPTRRPKIDEVVKRFDVIRRSLRWWTLRSRLVELQERLYLIDPPLRRVHHLFRTIAHIVTFKKAIPTPQP